MKTNEFKRELEVLIKARYPMIHCETFEELRLLSFIDQMNSERGVQTVRWTQTRGFYKKDGEAIDRTTSPEKCLRYIEESKENACFVLFDFHPFVKDAAIVRLLRELGQRLKTTKKNIIFSSPTLAIPPELSKELAVLRMPLPDRDEVSAILERTPLRLALESSASEPLIEAALGLTYDEIENVVAKSLVKNGSIDVGEILTEKRQIVQKAGILEFIPVNREFNSIGGLENLKGWLSRRKRGFSVEARAKNLPSPKGILLVGLPGCGKSLTAICTGASWQLPLLRLDMGKVFSGLVGSSEANLRTALYTAESVAPCILWIDEIEKGIGGGGGSDGGTSSRVFGSFLTWMQEKRSSVFVLATANDISALPPEMLRKGRFDEIFFVDVPSVQDRVEILEIHLQKRGWNLNDLDKDVFISKSDAFTGAEIEQALIDAAYDAFFLEEELAFKHLAHALDKTVPIAVTMKEKIESVRNWAHHRAVPAAMSQSSEDIADKRLIEL